jgi:uncharacterized membrane protein
MSDDTAKNYEVMFAVYGTEDGAAGAVEALRTMDKDGTIDIVDAATLIKDAEGKTSVKQESLPSVKKGTGIGALIGGAIGLLFPPSILGAAAIGAGIGAGTAKLAKMALEDDDLKEAADSLEPGSSAFIAIVENTWVEKVDTAITGYDKLAEHTMDAEAAGVIGEIVSGSGETAVEYGAGRGPEGAAAFVAGADSDTVAATAVAATTDDQGNVVVEQVAAVGDISDDDDETSEESSSE